MRAPVARRLAPAIAAAIAAIALGGKPGEAASAALKVGTVTWHAAKFVGKDLVLQGYVLAIEEGYVLFSDEAAGKITAHDLPVSGAGAESMQMAKKYVIEGVITNHGLTADNGSPYHLELTKPPIEPKP